MTTTDRRPPGAISSVVLGATLLAALFWQFGGVTAADGQFQVLDPDLHLIWKTVIILTLGISALCSLRAWTQRGWTIPVAVVNTGANWVSGAVIVALTAKGALFSPDLPQQVEATFGSSPEWSAITEVFLILVAGVAIWDSVDGLLRARHDKRPAGM
ncbi:MAG TPA: hypothetical protein H9871_04780 [Candidatus Nesterenkonia stercoripullorum]|uniref:Uncharacterized protein n=1 Tax=Candidatus Nesterenkonia stercoripullorum TaxID=2838701 RepID=A0A9D1S1J4_9MICC|nr:hypothetical protein [Candidatus Nesterenkonia stercoripullorum]